MSQGKITLALLLACALVRTADAVLLAEVGTNVSGFEQTPPATDSAFYGFFASSSTPPPAFGEWLRAVTATDVGLTFEAPLETVESFSRALTRPSAEIGISVHRISNSRPLDQLQAGSWPECCDIVTFRKFVPDITKVPVNRLTMTIDSFRFDRAGDTAVIGGAHTIRIYGVPEPISLIHCGVALLIYNRRARK